MRLFLGVNAARSSSQDEETLLRSLPGSTSGNRCGHLPQNPVLALLHPPKVGVGGLPRILTLAMERVDRYFFNRSLLPSLNYSRCFKRKRKRPRRQRSERAESCTLVLKAMLTYTDLASLRVGIHINSSIIPVTHKKLHQMTGLSLSRIERAIPDLVHSGIIKTKLITELQNGKPIRRAIRYLSAWFFRALGLGTQFDYEYKKAQKRNKKKSLHSPSEEQKARTQGFFSGLSRKLSRKPAEQSQKPTLQLKDEHFMRKFNEVALSLIREFPEKSSDEIRQLAHRIVQKHTS